MDYTLHAGDCLDVLRTLGAHTVDAVVTDPPYGLAFMGAAWDHAVPGPEYFRELLRVAKPGAHLVAFGGTRLFHRLAVSIEDAGWEIRDTLSWLYGSGFPKSLAIDKAIDREAGAVREVVGSMRLTGTARIVGGQGSNSAGRADELYGSRELRDELPLTAPATELAKRFDGYGTALKPAWEPIVLAMAPLIGTYAANAKAHGVAGLHIDAARIGDEGGTMSVGGPNFLNKVYGRGMGGLGVASIPKGRWPANLVLDEEAAAALDEQSRASGVHGAGRARSGSAEPRPTAESTWQGPSIRDTGAMHRFGDSGGASRFFYTAKAGREDRWVHLSCDCGAPIVSPWENEDRNPPAPTVSTSRPRDTCAAQSTDVSSSSTLPFGSELAGPSPQDSRSITSTSARATTDSKTSSSSQPSNTSESIAGARSETGNGGSRAESAESSSPSGPPTGTSRVRDGRSMGVAVPVTLRGPSGTSNCAACGKPLQRAGHSTVKPTDLMRWLVRLVKPPGRCTILDPFMGSGSTGVACVVEGVDFVGIDREQRWVDVARARIRRAHRIGPEVLTGADGTRAIQHGLFAGELDR